MMPLDKRKELLGRHVFASPPLARTRKGKCGAQECSTVRQCTKSAQAPVLSQQCNERCLVLWLATDFS